MPTMSMKPPPTSKATPTPSVHVKTHSLLIDLTKCLPARKVAPVPPPLLQVYPMKLRGDWQAVLEQMQKEAEKAKKVETSRSSRQP